MNDNESEEPMGSAVQLMTSPRVAIVWTLPHAERFSASGSPSRSVVIGRASGEGTVDSDSRGSDSDCVFALCAFRSGCCSPVPSAVKDIRAMAALRFLWISQGIGRNRGTEISRRQRLMAHEAEGTSCRSCCRLGIPPMLQ
ncbi:uncharacterized protein SEPMUDRAFT_76129 [Sphaerulina musiva SO2202]|uniref:Uncharacterized protein n=1 Tax=Sphaerulina musiva (strain SO2202) TaxID=692275 RepID=N1QHN2_SPHMS|nr:uncharacterized protein SEPMUDRAFT_76129 [Sphaerulina musiva SO2202]EMF16685.1 hypothetical protein SEPMUDRAFT_76129 [Sphaerulina musiva SO2202]